MSTTTVYDTIRTVVYDTVHTSVFDTVHTVSFDTVKVVLDSSFTPQVLRDSQAFYSWAFAALLATVAIFMVVLIFGAERLWSKSVNLQIERLKKDFETIAKKVTDDAKKDFEDKVSGISKRLNELSGDVEKVIPKLVMSYLSQAKTAGTADAFRICSVALDLMAVNFNFNLVPVADKVITFVRNLVVHEAATMNEDVRKELMYSIECFEASYLAYFVDKPDDEKAEALKVIDKAKAAVSILDKK